MAVDLTNPAPDWREFLTSIRLNLLGESVVIQGSSANAADHIARDWSRCLDVGRGVDKSEAPIQVTFTGPTDADRYVATTSLTFRLIDALSGRRLMFHACGLSHDEGRVLALVAASGTGKSTAARRLARETFGYVTDETVVVDDDGHVEAYPKPLAFIEEGGGKVQRGPDELGLRPCADDLTLSRVVLLDRRTVESAAELEPLSLLDAMVELIPQTSALPSLPRPLQRLADSLTACGGAYRLTYSEIDEAEPLLVDLMAGPAEQTEEYAPVDPPQSADRLALKDGRWTVAPWLDAVVVGDEALLLIDGTPMRLAGIGLTIWRALMDGVDTTDLTAHIVAVHSDHPDADELVRQATMALVDAGAVVHRLPKTLAQVMRGESTDDPSSRWAGRGDTDH